MSPQRLAARDGRAFVVREARPAEAGAILDLAWLVHSTDPDVMVPDPDEYRVTVEHMRGFVGRLAAEEHSIFLVAAADGAVVGTLTVQGARERKLRHTGELGLAVHPEWRRQGVGRALVAAALAPGVLRLRRVTLRVFATNLPALALYESLGFREEGRLKGHVRLGDRFVDEVRMAIEIRRPGASRDPSGR